MRKLIFIILIPVLFGFILVEKEKQVNTYTRSYQREPAIAISKTSGKYIVVWTSNEQDGDGEGINAQYFDKNDAKVGSEFRINTTTYSDQNKPSVDMNSSGRCVIVWASHRPDSLNQDVYCQIIDESGNKAGGELLVNTTIVNSQTCPDVAMDDNGNFVVVWHSWDQDGGDRGVYAQRFRNDGVKIGTEFLVNTCTAYSQAEPSIDMTPDGKFIVVWQSWKQENPSLDDYGIYAQIFNSDGTKSGTEFHVNTTTEDNQFFPDVAISDTGNFIITWTNWVTYDPTNSWANPFYGEIFAQRFDSKGNKVGNEFYVNSTYLEYQWLPSVTLHINGSFVVAWGSWKQDGSREGVFLQFFKPDGSRNGREHLVNYYMDNYQWEPQVVFSGINDVIVVYSSYNQDGDDYGIFTRRVFDWQTDIKTPEEKKEHGFNLKQNYPNPFNPETVIEYSQPRNTNVKINIYDSSGKLIKALNPSDQNTGLHTIKWDGLDENNRKVSSGVYMYTIFLDNKQLSRKMILIK